jgi:hypothetical protein
MMDFSKMGAGKKQSLWKRIRHRKNNASAKSDIGVMASSNVSFEVSHCNIDLWRRLPLAYMISESYKA